MTSDPTFSHQSRERSSRDSGIGSQQATPTLSPSPNDASPPRPHDDEYDNNDGATPLQASPLRTSGHSLSPSASGGGSETDLTRSHSSNSLKKLRVYPTPTTPPRSPSAKHLVRRGSAEVKSSSGGGGGSSRPRDVSEKQRKVSKSAKNNRKGLLLSPWRKTGREKSPEPFNAAKYRTS